jgi:exodeoxyribonuclease VII small subunit
MSSKQKTFEASLTELEQIVRQLEDGDLSLEESLELFENGVRLSRECQEKLAQAERRIEVLLKDETGNPVLQELNPENLQEKKESDLKRRIIFNEEDAP